MKAARKIRQHLGVPGTAALAIVLAAVIGAGALVVSHSSASRPKSGSVVLDGSHPKKVAHHHHAKVRPIHLVSVWPRAGEAGVTFTPHVIVKFSQPLGQKTVLPVLSPSLPGTWSRTAPNELEFQPTGNYWPFTRVSVHVPGGPTGITSAGGATLAATHVTHFTVRAGSTLRLQQLLAELGYLPVNFTPSPTSSTSAATGSYQGTQATAATTSSQTTPTTAALPPGPSGPPGYGTVLSNPPATPAADISEPARAVDIPLVPLKGTFSWRYPNVPRALSSLWSPGSYNVMTQGAVMSFEENNGLATDGVAGPIVWATLLHAVATRQVNTFGYDWVYVSMGSPEYVNLWRNGQVIFQTLANTGIPQSPTQPGTWPVYLRFVTTTMSGTNPNGTHYNDPGIPWVSYFHGGDALHGFIRAAYGFPQSLGCVEMPFSSAQTLYPYTPIGTLVTVAN